jgi:hypothetical protein
MVFQTEMFDWSIDPRSQLALLCVVTAFVFWNNDLLFFTFCILGLCTRLVQAIRRVRQNYAQDCILRWRMVQLVVARMRPQANELRKKLDQPTQIQGYLCAKGWA